ncbi:hypothetical protein [Chroococcidiopsis sp. TS-821]|nr:hypothetical protein [Chroococcidiopsis sp. TS-821]AFZ33538.1 hypothetical protein Glo7428_5155 [Gloeocapsa sp. PCC 7428]PPS42109.1 hypothetical protein B1A85_16410 [Chroococcidiopsis sp. TS-821]
MHQIFRIILLFAMGLATAIATAFCHSAQARLPSYQTCIAPLGLERVEQIGTARLQAQAYYLLAAYEQGDEDATDLVVAATGKTCQRLFYNPTGDRTPLAGSMPLAVAQQLTLQRYRKELNEMGRSALQQQAISASESAEQWFAEETWALKRLGIAVPATLD